jgi:hypothetical protein
MNARPETAGSPGLRGRDQRERLGCRAGRGCAFAFTPFPSYRSIGFGAVARSGQGRPVCGTFIVDP